MFFNIPVVYFYRPFEDLDRTLPKYSFAKQAILANFQRFFELLDKRHQYLCAPTSPRIPSNLEDIVPSSPSAPRDQNHCNPCRLRKQRGRYLDDRFSGLLLKSKQGTRVIC